MIEAANDYHNKKPNNFHNEPFQHSEFVIQSYACRRKKYF